VIATLPSRQCGYSAVSLVSRMNFFQLDENRHSAKVKRSGLQ
jgi:hypothetical protein